MELNETVTMMNNADYKERFKAEYWQTKVRYDKLHNMVVKLEAGTLDFEPTCPLRLFKKQLSAMGSYLYTLEVRAELEDVDLNDVDSAE